MKVVIQYYITFIEVNSVLKYHSTLVYVVEKLFVGF